MVIFFFSHIDEFDSKYYVFYVLFKEFPFFRIKNAVFPYLAHGPVLWGNWLCFSTADFTDWSRICHIILLSKSLCYIAYFNIGFVFSKKVNL